MQGQDSGPPGREGPVAGCRPLKSRPPRPEKPAAVPGSRQRRAGPAIRLPVRTGACAPRGPDGAERVGQGARAWRF